LGSSLLNFGKRLVSAGVDTIQRSVTLKQTMLDDLKGLFKNGNFIGQIIVINAVVFLLENLISNFSPAAGGEILRWFAMHSYLPSVLTSPWSVFTYMFMHASFGHVFWNMVILYYFGRIVNDMMGKARLVGLYYLGGIAGALFYLVAYSIQVLWGQPIADIPLVGASAAIMAVVAFAGLRFGDYQMNLLLIGPVKLRYVALGLFVMNTLLDLSMNTGGKLSHLGGAALGFFYYRSLNGGKDYAVQFSNLINSLGGIFKKKSPLRVVPSDKKKAAPSRQKATKETEARTNAILDKISKSGYDNLSKEEKDFLFRVSNKK
jgi:membrane associated rhomboid family serine protease